jgi:predicted AlkP superfamily pyrophosphatase or phosphodiesterase
MDLDTSMKHCSYFWKLTVLVIGFLLIAGPVASETNKVEGSKPLVILISLDGFRPAYLSSTDTPNLIKLAGKGAIAKGLLSSFPSVTFPNHVTLVTGQTPDHHGIVNNIMKDSEIDHDFSIGSREAIEDSRWWAESRPIWVSMRQQGKIASTIFWPGSETEILGLRPNDWLRYEHSLSHEARLQTLLSWLDRPTSERPDLVTLYFSDVDSAGHAAGPESDAVKVAVRKVDATLGKLVKTLDERGMLLATTFVIVSDHGMASVSPKGAIRVQGVLSDFPASTWDWLGTTAAVRLNGESLAGVMKSLKSLEHVTCWPKSEVPERFRFGSHRRIPDIVCLADSGYFVADRIALVNPGGMHGYDPSLTEMHGILIVTGPEIVPMKLGLIQNTEVYGLLAHLVKIIPNQNDGLDTLYMNVTVGGFTVQ